MSWIDRHAEATIFRDNLRAKGLRTTLGVLAWNLRFELGYRIGGFTQARR